jgi:hypothetical protein
VTATCPQPGQGAAAGGRGRADPDLREFDAKFAPTTCLSAALYYCHRGLSVTVLCTPDHQGVPRWHTNCKNPGKVPHYSWKRNRYMVSEVNPRSFHGNGFLIHSKRANACRG